MTISINQIKSDKGVNIVYSKSELDNLIHEAYHGFNSIEDIEWNFSSNRLAGFLYTDDPVNEESAFTWYISPCATDEDVREAWHGVN